MQKEVIFPGIIVYKNAIKKEWNLIEEYEDILGKENSRYSWQPAQVGFFEDNKSHRDCEDFKYTEDSLGPVTKDNEKLYMMHNMIRNALWECLDDYQKEYGVRIGWMGAINVVKYGQNNFFNVHSDDGDPYRCTVSAVGYVNDNYSGGELWFKYFDKTVKPQAGDLILFPSSYIYSHASLPIESGTKYSLVIMTDRTEFAHKSESPIYHST